MLDSNAVRAEMARLLRQPVGRLEDKTVLTTLVADSFDLVEMVIGLQDRFEVRLTQEDLKAVRTVGDLEGVMVGKAR